MVPVYDAHLKAKVVLLGGMGVGKTSLIRRYVLDEFDDSYVATLGAKVSKRSQPVELPDAGRVLVDLTIWDTMGEEVLRPTLADIVLHGVKGVLAVCDVTDEASVAPMSEWIDLASRLRADDVPVQILVNKRDLGTDEAGVVRTALGLGRPHVAPCYLTSARTGDNVAAAFEDLALRIASRALAEGETRFDTAFLGMVIDASVKLRALADLAESAGLPLPATRARAESLVRRGYLRIASIDLGPDGRPALSFSATGKPFPPLAGPTARITGQA